MGNVTLLLYNVLYWSAIPITEIFLLREIDFRKIESVRNVLLILNDNGQGRHLERILPASIARNLISGFSKKLRYGTVFGYILTISRKCGCRLGRYVLWLVEGWFSKTNILILFFIFILKPYLYNCLTSFFYNVINIWTNDCNKFKKITTLNRVMYDFGY